MESLYIATHFGYVCPPGHAPHLTRRGYTRCGQLMPMWKLGRHYPHQSRGKLTCHGCGAGTAAAAGLLNPEDR